MTEATADRQPTIKPLLDATADAWNKFIAIVDSVPADRVDEPGVCGDWAVKTIVGHVAFWDGYEVEKLAREDEFESVDFQPLNEQNALETALKSYAELRSELETNHALAIAAVCARPTLSPDYIREMLDDHYIEHGREIEAWLATP